MKRSAPLGRSAPDGPKLTPLSRDVDGMMTFSYAATALTLPPTPHDTSDFELVWPSGYGVEVGVALLTIAEAWHRISHGASRLSNRGRLTEVEEDGLRALVIQGLDVSPLTLLSEPEIDPDLLAIHADSAADPDAVLSVLRSILPLTEIRMNGPLPSLEDLGL